MNKLSMLLPTLLLITACEYLPISGGLLIGELTSPPADWTEIASPKVIELETNPSRPYSVKLWVVGEGKNLYVHAGVNRAQWVENMEQEPNVRVLIEGKLFELQAKRIVSAATFKAFADIYEQKYGSRPGNENVEEAYLYRLLPRS